MFLIKPQKTFILVSKLFAVTNVEIMLISFLSLVLVGFKV